VKKKKSAVTHICVPLFILCLFLHTSFKLFSLQLSFSCYDLDASSKDPCVKRLVPRMVLLAGGRTFKRWDLLGGL
jgi:hypothetical protein